MTSCEQVPGPHNASNHPAYPEQPSTDSTDNGRPRASEAAPSTQSAPISLQRLHTRKPSADRAAENPPVAKPAARFRISEVDVEEPGLPRRAPEMTFNVEPHPATQSTHFMVISANKHATDAGYRVLEAGGRAIDALIAVQAMLTLTEPQSSSLIGGGAMITYFDKKSGRTVVIDGRETAPLAARPDRFLGPDGEPVDFDEALRGGRAAGVPGCLAALELGYKLFSSKKVPWDALMEPATQLADKGFEISPRLADTIAADHILRTQPTSVLGRYFYGSNGKPLPAGATLKNPALARALRLIGAQGAQKAFYEGPIGRDFVETARASKPYPSDVTASDLLVYRAIVRDPITYPVHAPDGQVYELNTVPPPGGGTSLIEIAGVLDEIGLETLLPNWAKRQTWSADFLHVAAEAQRLSYVDKNYYLADPDPAFGSPPQAFLTDSRYLRHRASLIRREEVMGRARPGRVALTERTDGEAPEFPSTTHITIVDAEGNVASCTSSIEDMNGSRLMSEEYGYIFNNTMTDFKLQPVQHGRLATGRIQPGARAPSSMSASIMHKINGDGELEFHAGLGSPGGPAIVPYTFKTMAGLLMGMDPAEASNAPNFRGLPSRVIDVERNTPAEQLAEALQSRGHRVRLVDMNSGITAIVRQPDGTLIGGGDGRREITWRGV